MKSIVVGVLVAVFSVVEFSTVAYSADNPPVDYAFQILAFPGAAGTYPTGINSRGDIVGNYRDVRLSDPYHQGALHGFLLKDGQYYTIDKPGAYQTYLAGINDSGAMIGTAVELRGMDTDSHAFVRVDENNYLTVEPSGFARSTGFAINTHGDVIGIATPSSDSAFLYSDSSYLQGLVGPFGLWARALNVDRKYVGYGVPNNFDMDCGCSDSYLSDGSNATILAFPGAHVTQANAINDAGAVAGDYFIYNSTGRVIYASGFVYVDGGYQEIRVPGSTYTSVTSINSFGDVVGNYNSHAFVGIATRPAASQQFDAAFILTPDLQIGRVSMAELKKLTPQIQP